MDSLTEYQLFRDLRELEKGKEDLDRLVEEVNETILKLTKRLAELEQSLRLQSIL